MNEQYISHGYISLHISHTGITLTPPHIVAIHLLHNCRLKTLWYNINCVQGVIVAEVFIINDKEGFFSYEILEGFADKGIYNKNCNW